MAMTKDAAKSIVLEVSDWLLLLLALALVCYLILAVTALIGTPPLAEFKAHLLEFEATELGIPAAAVGAYAVVTMLLHAFPPAKEGGTVNIKVLGLTFTGPAGPITLWVLCFLSFCVAIAVLRQ